METPNITPAQLLSFVTVVVGQLVAWGLLSAGNGSLAVSIATTVVPAVWMIADMFIRRARANNVESILRTRELYAAPGEAYVGD